MKTKITIFLTFIIMYTINPSGSYSQTNILKNTKPEQRAALITEWMKNNLHISEEQVGKLEKVNLKYAKKIQVVVENENLSSFKKLDQGRKIDKEKEKELKSILTNEQFELYIKNKDQLQRYMKERLNASK